MRIIYSILLFSPLLGFSQKNKSWLEKNDVEWNHGEVTMLDGQKGEFDMRFVISWNEGALQIKNGDLIETLTPRKVHSFVYFDSVLDAHREFRSVDCFFIKKGQTKAFLELVYEGKEYSLFRRYVPDSKISGIVLPIGWAVWAEAKIEPTLFIQPKNGSAIQASVKSANLQDRPSFDKVRYVLSRENLTSIFGEGWEDMKKFARENQLDITMESGFVEALKFIQGATFTYDRKETPKQFRN